ncbi:MAG: restriction endonuclease subunit R [Acidimicrobiaceae bacterium]|nr:restriction endonuclease subunit R [Acidimicrobiaceae bacterium]MYE96062.1 restriction endonuclease subunit R [Acidimicrobiaceae bacterium]MYI54163.1 restriction endonuclease subunit R [Acidimicrobiaceae bacterium]MYJ82523.1 restriction endonuclease subunit R [Acidimicrobiaceae bacterium]
MILKEYQQRTLATVRSFLEELATWQQKDAAARDQDPDWGFDWVQRAWTATAVGRPYTSRRNGLDEQLPAFCLKIPTGGGKTLLATRVIDLVNAHFRRSRRGLVLWIVPTTQIYNQTLKALKDRDHPYRQQLDLSSGQRTLILEKTTAFGPRDVAENLCVLLLMLPSANRQTKETLRMFRDSGGFDRFFPPDDDPTAHAALLESCPNLDTFEQAAGFWGRYVKTSLGNTVRVLKPLIILDEGHKAYSTNAKATLEGFNPCMIVELSATPVKGANVLVEILGRELNAEEMIKLDLHIHNKTSGDWRGALLESVEHRERLEVEARRHEAESGTYIRPICVIQVERTGREQRKPGYVHTDDVREYLLQHPGIAPEHVAVKTSSTDELKAVDDIGGLMSRDCPIRFIITKQALQEGWDCSFAYILTILTNPASRTGLTQLVGRILRQPYADKTGVALLDESHVFCFSRRGAEVLQEVRKGFGLEGLQGLEGRVLEVDPANPKETLTTRQRAEYRAATRDFVLPAFMINDDGWRLVRYEADILSRLPWDDIDLSPLDDLTLDEGRQEDHHLRASLSGAERVLEPEVESGGHNGQGVATEEADSGMVGEPVDYFFAASHLLDMVPNPWRGRDLARRTFEGLLERYPAEQVAANHTFVLEELRQQVEMERDRLSRKVFAGLLASGEVRFMVVADDLDFNRLPAEIEVPEARRANREDGAPYQHNLFDVTTEDDLNQFENKVATYLDQQARLFFWYRNRARKDYYVQGWRPRKIFADFIVTLRGDESGADDDFHQVFVVETKGVHLKASEDTEYKRSVFDICSEHARRADWTEFVPAMRTKVLRFEVVDEDEWQARLNGMLFAAAP